MALVRSRARHGADLDARAPRQGPRAYLAGVLHELRRLERPGPRALARGTGATLGVCAAITAYLAGCDRLVAAIADLLF